MLTRITMLIFLALLALMSACLNAEEGKMDELLFEENFSDGLDNWWVEGGERVWIEDGKLHVKADPAVGKDGYVCTVWCRKTFPADLKVEFDAHVISSTIDANNINFFLSYSDPSGVPLYDTRESRASAAYKLYHGLNGYIFTFLNDFKRKGGAYPDGSPKARIRIRRCPGFRLLSEKYDYRCRQGETYHVTIIKRGGRLSIDIDGKVSLTATDDAPLSGGLIGLRTFRTYLWWDNIRVTRALE